MSQTTDTTGKQSYRDSLALDVAEARARLGEKRFRLIKQWMDEVTGVYNAAVASYVHPDTALLDAGCSRGDPDIPAIEQAGLSIGCDGDLPGLRGNAQVTDRITVPGGGVESLNVAVAGALCCYELTGRGKDAQP